MTSLRSLLSSRTFGAALTFAALWGTLEATRPRRTVIQELDGELGWVMLPDQRQFDQFLRTPEEINSFGFRGGAWNLEKTPGTARICVLGSSMTYGSAVEFDRIYTTLLEKKLRALGRSVEVFNCAVQGYVLEQSLLNYRAKVRRLRPDLVLQAFADQDIKPMDRYGEPPRGDLRPWLARSEFYRLFQWGWPKTLREAAPENPMPHWRKEERAKSGRWNELLRTNPFSPELKPLWDAARTTLETEWREVRADGAVLAVTVLPQRIEAIDPRFVGPEKEVRELLEGKEGAYYVDVIADLRNATAPIRERIGRTADPQQRNALLNGESSDDSSECYHRDKGGHFNERGMETIADALARGIAPLLPR